MLFPAKRTEPGNGGFERAVGNGRRIGEQAEVGGLRARALMRPVARNTATDQHDGPEDTPGVERGGTVVRIEHMAPLA